MNTKRNFILFVISLLLFAGVITTVYKDFGSKKDFRELEKSIMNLIENDKNYEHYFQVSPGGMWYYVKEEMGNDSKLSIISTSDNTIQTILTIPWKVNINQLTWFDNQTILSIFITKRRCISPELIIIHFENGAWQEPINYKMKKPITECYTLSTNENDGSLLISAYDDYTKRLQIEEIDYSGNTIYSSIINTKMSKDFQLIPYLGGELISYTHENATHLQLINKGNGYSEVSEFAVVEGVYRSVGINPKHNEVLLVEDVDYSQSTKKVVLFDLVKGTAKRTFQVNRLTCFDTSKNQGVLFYSCPSSNDDVVQYWDWAKEALVEEVAKINIEFVFGWNYDLGGYVVLEKVNNQPKLGLIQIR